MDRRDIFPRGGQMKLRILFAISIAVAATMAIGPSPALAEDAALKRAQEAFDQAQVLYLQGKYDEAADGFKKAYEARPFPTFVFNIAVAYQSKGKSGNDVDAYKKAVEYYKRYLAEDPQAQDKPKVEKRVAAIEEEIARLAAQPAATPDQPAAPPPPPPPAVAAELAEVQVRGLIVIESSPQGANIYIDGKEKGVFGQTPWSGSLAGEHHFLVEKRGYKVAEKRLAPDPSKLVVLEFVMAEEDYLGWLEIKSNVPGAEIFLDDKAVGAIGKTPFSGNFKPGKHTIWVTAEGYDEVENNIEIIAGETHEVNAQLRGSPLGYLNLRGAGIEDSEILVDGKVLCERGPCRKGVREGVHTITVRRPGYKTYTRRLEIQAKTEASIKVGLSEKPSRTDAIIAGVLAAGFAGGGIYLGSEAASIKDKLEDDIAAGAPPVDPKDKRFDRGKIYAIAADGAFVLAGVTALTAIYYTFRDKGPPSTATIDVRALSVVPQIGPSYAGLGMEVSW
jgi:tetratricopeptide (TPR) repeat protein